MPTQLEHIEFVNIRCRFAPNKKVNWGNYPKVILAAHYETKKYDNFRFVGANDGGSGVAAIIEIARVLGESAPNYAKHIEIVFFDGEEAFGTNIKMQGNTPFDGLYGSFYFAQQIAGLPAKAKPKLGLVLDMVGDADLMIRIPANCSRTLIPDAFDAAKMLNLRRFFGTDYRIILDDHQPLITKAGIPSLNFIDLDYPYWHTQHDTMDKVSADSFRTVGATSILFLLMQIDKIN